MCRLSPKIHMEFEDTDSRREHEKVKPLSSISAHASSAAPVSEVELVDASETVAGTKRHNKIQHMQHYRRINRCFLYP